MFVKERLDEAGVQTALFARDLARPNLLARVKGRGEAPPLLLYGHVDVVPVSGQRWAQPPFAGELVDGWVWGRGALDMKSAIAMYVDATLAAAQEPPAGDLLLLVLADEEAGGIDGAAFLVENHREIFAGVRHALGEFGGTTVHLGGRRLYPVMVAEKLSCILTAKLRGAGGHGSLRHTGGATAKLARMLDRLDRRRLPVHVTPAARLMVGAIADALGGVRGAALRQVLRPALTDRILDRLGPQVRALDSSLHNTVNATIVRGGDRDNVIPSEVSVVLDCRLLPGWSPEQVIAELHDVLGPDVEFRVDRWDPGGDHLDTSQFEMLAGVLRDADPGCHPFPHLFPAVTDGRHLSRLNIQTYGFTPLRLPPGFDFAYTVHAADERVPAEAVEFGARAVREAVRRYRPAGSG
jgi:acetylornithine deacetylase/succinyl-diaminopimelate desuccinylase-like protein